MENMETSYGPTYNLKYQDFEQFIYLFDQRFFSENALDEVI